MNKKKELLQDKKDLTNTRVLEMSKFYRKKKSNNNTDKWSLFITSMTILILIGSLTFLFYGTVGFQNLVHTQKLEELKLEKEIALINNKYEYKEYADLDLLIKSIDKIEKDCGSTQIVKEYGSSEWSTFHPLQPNPYLYLKECYKK